MQSTTWIKMAVTGAFTLGCASEGPLETRQEAGLVGSFNFQIEFMSGREFGMRVRGEGIALLNRARDLLLGLEAVVRPAKS
jgi:hypothetical protein